MQARPILFSAPMVRALLDRTKTQTRRIIKPQPTGAGAAHGVADKQACQLHYEQLYGVTKCPYGNPGDFLWVRETLRADHDTSDAVTLAKYDADGAAVLYPGPEKDENGDDDYGGSCAHWQGGRDVRPSIHMHRWASRLTLEITDVRVERLQEISPADAHAEGFALDIPNPWACFRYLWKGINGEDSWNANPWVWALTFKVHKANIDDLLRDKAA